MITDFKWLYIPTLSQHTSEQTLRSENISAAMIYNYYQKINGNSEYVKVDKEKLLYPESINDKIKTINPKELLDTISNQWHKHDLLSQRSRIDDYSDINLGELIHIIKPVIRSIEYNNPILFYSGIPGSAYEFGMGVVISGYQITDETVWLLIDDPDYISSEQTKKEEAFGSDFFHLLFKGEKEKWGCRYKIDLRALLKEKEKSFWGRSFYCDHSLNPGFTVFINDCETDESSLVLIDLEEDFKFPIKSSDDTIDITDKSAKELFDKNEKEVVGGGFPLGSNQSWHGGIHLKAEENTPVYSVCHGELICLRLPEEDPEKDNLLYGSRNFVLLRHAVGEQKWYSLYYHLKPMDTTSSEISWLANETAEITEDSEFRLEPSQDDNAPILISKKGDKLSIIDTENDPWYKVRYQSNGLEGYVEFASERMSIYEEMKNELNEGSVVKPSSSIFIKAGDMIGSVGESITIDNSGKPVLQPILHWQIFSSEIISDNWIPIEDPLNEWRIKTDDIIKIINDSISKATNQIEEIKEEEENLILNNVQTLTSIDEIYSKQDIKSEFFRLVASKFFSEFAVNWKEVAQKMLADNKRINSAKLSLYGFWDDMDIDPNIWHYNPIEFMRKLYLGVRTINVPDFVFHEDSSFVIPEYLSQIKQHIKDILSRIPENGEEFPQLIFKQSTTDELAKKRNDVLNWYYKNDLDNITNQFEIGEWGASEQAYLFSYIPHPLGGNYYPYSFVESDFEEDEESMQLLKDTITEFKEKETEMLNVNEQFDSETARIVVGQIVDVIDGELQ